MSYVAHYHGDYACSPHSKPSLQVTHFIEKFDLCKYADDSVVSNVGYNVATLRIVVELSGRLKYKFNLQGPLK